MQELRIGVIGTGYAGLVTAICLADFGFHISCADMDPEKIRSLNMGEIPVYEPGLEVVFDRVRNLERIDFSCKIEAVIRNSNVIFMCKETPSLSDGSADLSAVWQVAASIGRVMEDHKIIVENSTVPVGTSRKIASIIEEELSKRALIHTFDVVSNPEFLREGKALYDFTHPDRIVIGSDHPETSQIMKRIYNPLKLNEIPFVITNPETAELIKYAYSGFLATKIAFINEMANLCEAVGADVHGKNNGNGWTDKFRISASGIWRKPLSPGYQDSDLHGKG